MNEINDAKLATALEWLRLYKHEELIDIKSIIDDSVSGFAGATLQEAGSSLI